MQRSVLGCCIVWIGLSSMAWAQTAKPKKSTKERMQQSQAKADSLRDRLQRSTGLEAQLPGMNPSGSLALPGGKGKTTDLSTLLGETIPDLGLKAKEYKDHRAERRRKAKKGRLARVQYEGILMEKLAVKFGSGDRATIEEFHVLKEYQPISPYVRNTQLRWYDLKKKNLSSSVIQEKEKALPLHGPYKRYTAGVLVEEGYYYMGTKDGRWARYDAKYNLLDKSHWYRGFPAESRITWYDSAHTKIKEVVPVQFGIVDGEYLRFYDGGQLMTTGKYERGKKVGRWIEYYQYRRQRKQETQYPATCWDEDFEPFVLREWDDKGKMLYDYSKDPRASAEVVEGDN
ncbi:hypothetical protein [Telluribacter sp.]|uniref:toxin-antitoxin system YwqK family antitoxin n=1 Tax=Telluribacter sp. TaxID=1978767 RepID=UPI002E156B37|nr:hypothetical protein [Telluribacter sp.]